MANSKFFVSADNNGMVSAELQATTLGDARRELRAAISDRSIIDLLDGSNTDLEDELGVDCDGLSYSDAEDACSRAGATQPTDAIDEYQIWEVEVAA